MEEDKVKELVERFKTGTVPTNPFIDRLEKLGVPKWMGKLIVAGIQPVRGDYEKTKNLCEQFQEGTLRIDQFTDALEKEGMPCWIGFVLHDMHYNVRFLENVGKLSPEDQVVAHRWKRQREERRQVYKQLDTISKKDNPEEWDALMDKVREPMHCEHGRSWASSCYSCDEIHKTLFPEMVPADEDD